MINDNFQKKIIIIKNNNNLNNNKLNKLNISSLTSSRVDKLLHFLQEGRAVS